MNRLPSTRLHGGVRNEIALHVIAVVAVSSATVEPVTSATLPSHFRTMIIWPFPSYSACEKA